MTIFCLALAGMAVFQNCSEVNFDKNSNQEKAFNPNGKVQSCSTDDFTKLMDDHPVGSKVYSSVFIGGNSLPSNYSHNFIFQALGTSASDRDFKIADPIYNHSIDNVVAQSAGVLIPILNDMKIPLEPTSITYCQARELCERILKSGPKWRNMYCEFAQYEFDSTGYVDQQNASNPGGHLKTYKRIKLFTGGDGFCVGNEQDSSIFVKSDNGIDHYEKVSKCYTSAEFVQMRDSGDFEFRH